MQANQPASVATAPDPYPEEWIFRGRSRVSMACMHLVYKDHCKVTRTGPIVFNVTLDDDGKVESLRLVKNGVRIDPELAEECFKNALTGATFEKPGSHEHSFDVRFVLADKC